MRTADRWAARLRPQRRRAFEFETATSRSAGLGLLAADCVDRPLTTVVGASVGLIGFVVTVSVLVVQMATGTFSARYMRLWYRDIVLKATLAVLMGTLIFSYTLIRRIDEAVPSLGRVVAGFLLAVGLAAVPRLPRPRPPSTATRQGGRNRGALGSRGASGHRRARDDAATLRRRCRARRRSSRRSRRSLSAAASRVRCRRSMTRAFSPGRRTTTR